MVNPRVLAYETHITDQMQFPALSLEDATSIFTEAAYGQRIKIS